MLGRGIGPNRKEDMSEKEMLRRLDAAMSKLPGSLDDWYELSHTIDTMTKNQTTGHGLVNRCVDFGGDSYHTLKFVSKHYIK
jgi:hypothetical protein